MCVLCYELVSEDHWADALSDPSSGAVPGSWLYRRAKVLSAVLAAYGLAVSHPGTGRHCVVADRKGAAELAAGLPEVWRAAQKMTSRPIDVLDPLLLQAIAASTRSEGRV